MTIIALILAMLVSLIPANSEASAVVIIPAVTEADEWEMYNQEAYYDYVAEFTQLFNSYEVKRAKNNALMIRSGNSGSFKFAKRSI